MQLCKFSTINASQLRRHKKIHSKIKPYKCEKCSFTSHTKSSVNKHRLNIHESENLKRYKCSYCTFSTIYLDSYKNHQNIPKYSVRSCRIPKGAKEYQCHMCSYETENISSFKRHKIKKHFDFKSLDSKSRNSYLEIDIKQGTEMPIKKCLSTTKPYKCEKCSYACRAKKFLKRHRLRMHEKENLKKYKCSYCSFSTIYLQNYKYHQNKKVSCRNPGPAKLFKCDHCSFDTDWIKSLRKHTMVKHLDVKPFKCSVCSFETNTSAGLKIHHIVHAKDQTKTTNETSSDQNMIVESTPMVSNSSKSILTPSSKLSRILDERIVSKATSNHFYEIDIKQETELSEVRRNQSKDLLNENSIDLIINFDQHKLNENLSTVKVENEVKYSDLMKAYSLKPQEVNSEEAFALSNTFTSKQFEISQLTCKSQIKKEKENLTDSLNNRVSSTGQSKADLNLFSKFRLKHLKITLENNLNVMINQHNHDHIANFHC